MFEQLPKEETLSIFKEIEQDPTTTQRVLSQKLGISLGKTNYLLQELVKKGFIRIKSFTDNPGKIGKIQYFLTKEGLDHRVSLIKVFLKKKEEEYNNLKLEWEQLTAKEGLVVNVNGEKNV
jgi:EPS-associated MarR family transcriptional regulator